MTLSLSLSKVTIKDVGYKKIKDAYPKKVCHMPTRHDNEKKRKKKRCIPKEGMPHAHKACRKKRRKKIAHIQGK
jgi:hypothetical protein